MVSMKRLDRIRFYIWCNTHWPEKLFFETNIINIEIWPDFIRYELAHPKWWFRGKACMYNIRWAKACYPNGDHPPKSKKEARERYGELND